jgi:hypothetical protein
MNATQPRWRDDPATIHALRSRAAPRRERSAAAFFRQILPSSRNRVKASQRPPSATMSLIALATGLMFGQAGVFGRVPAVQFDYKRADRFMADATSDIGIHPIDPTLDLEDGVEAFRGFQGHGRDLFGDRSARARRSLDVDQFEEFASSEGPTEGAEGRGRLVVGPEEVVVTAIGCRPGLPFGGAAHVLSGSNQPCVDCRQSPTGQWIVSDPRRIRTL